MQPPQFLFIHVNKRCNLRCQHCSFWMLDDSDRQNYLSWERKRDILAEFSELSPGGKVVICGGESMLANAFIAKPVLRITTTAGLIERLSVDRALRRICGFPMWKKLPDESTFSRAFAEFAKDGLAERCHEALIRETLGDQLIGHISRDGTAIEARETPACNAEALAPAAPKKRGHPGRSGAHLVGSGDKNAIE